MYLGHFLTVAVQLKANSIQGLNPNTKLYKENAIAIKANNLV